LILGPINILAGGKPIIKAAEFSGSRCMPFPPIAEKGGVIAFIRTSGTNPNGFEPASLNSSSSTADDILNRLRVNRDS
jgi:hypothetical protein